MTTTDRVSTGTTADCNTDKLYRHLRYRHGQGNPQANGYRLQAYFLREQEMIVKEVSAQHRKVVDIGCGSGLMIRPFIKMGKEVLGVDFNEIACRDASSNGIPVVRGDAYRLPLLDQSVDVVLNCQFLNQQTNSDAAHLINEIYRILGKGGRCILVWRNHGAWIHRVALVILNLVDRLSGRPVFPHYDNPIDLVESLCLEAGFVSVRKKELVFPLLRWRTSNTSGLPAKIIGASCFIVVDK